MTDSERRVPVQASRFFLNPSGNRVKRLGPGSVPGTISWEEHEEVWKVYAKRFGDSQSAERMAERHGFDWNELEDFLGHPPTTWRPMVRGERLGQQVAAANLIELKTEEILQLEMEVKDLKAHLERVRVAAFPVGADGCGTYNPDACLRQVREVLAQETDGMGGVLVRG